VQFNVKANGINVSNKLPTAVRSVSYYDQSV